MTDHCANESCIKEILIDTEAYDSRDLLIVSDPTKNGGNDIDVQIA